MRAHSLVAIAQFDAHVGVVRHGAFQRMRLGGLHFDQHGAILVTQCACGEHG